MAKWNKIGVPQNDGERKVFEYLEEHLPEEYTLFSNVSLSDHGKSLDLDGVLLAPHAIYIVEVKNAKGVSGDAFHWEITRLSGSKFVPRNHPLNIVEHKTRVLSSKLHQHRNLEDIYVQDCVCLYSPEESLKEVADDPDRMRKVFWYQGSEAFFTDSEALTIYPGERGRYSFNFQERHEEIKELLRTGFFKKPVLPPVEGDFTYVELAWESSRYRAFFLTMKRGDNAEPKERLLKAYSIPKNVPRKEREKYVEDLERDIQALTEIRDKGDPKTGGGKHVIHGLRAYPDEKFWHYHVLMEWVSGRPLSLLLEMGEPLSRREKYQIAAQLCRGLAFVHSAEVLHRDLRPSNILISTDGEVKITNFDFAKFYGEQKFPTIAVETAADLEKEHHGQLRYLAPELAAHRDYHQTTIATDIFSLGIVLVELFANRLFPDKLLLEQTDVAITMDAQVADLLTDMIAAEREIRQNFSLINAAEIFERLVEEKGDSDFPEFSPGDTFNSYRIVEHLKTTQLSSVYRAEHTTVDQQAVIKFIKTSSPLKALEEIRKAHDILGRIDPRYTARWLDGGRVFVDRGGALVDSEHPEAGEIYFQILEFIEGQTLREYIQRSLPETSKALRIALDTLRAVRTVHEVGWMHCDIKTENIIITPDEEIKIIDFGLSQKFEEGTPARYASPGYLPPEVENGQPWTFAGDVYATSCVLTALLVGENSGPRNGPRKDWALVEQKAGGEICHLLKRNQAQEPEKRSPSIEEFLKAFESAVKERIKEPMEVDVYYRQKLDELRQEASKKKKLGPKHKAEHAELAEVTDALENWLEQGRPGELPEVVQKFISQSSETPAGDVAPSPDDIPDENESKPSASLGELSAADSATEDDAPSNIQGETPAQKTLRREIERVHNLMGAGEWGQAAKLAGHIVDRSGEDAEIRERAESLRSKALEERERHLRKALDDGDQARADGDENKAREHYQTALRLDPDNAHARSARRELDAALTDMDTRLKELSRELGVRDDIERLGKAVYDAEALAVEDKLSAALLEKLGEARRFYDAERQRMGMGTTMARFGDLAARRLAVIRIELAYFDGDRTYYDGTVGQHRPIDEVLLEARTLLEEHSEDTKDFELGVVAGLKTTHPIAAKRHLEAAIRPPEAIAKRDAITAELEALKKDNTLSKEAKAEREVELETRLEVAKAQADPFHEDHRRELESELAKIEELIKAQESAGETLAKADEESDWVKMYALILQAQDAFAGIPGLAERVSQARRSASVSLTQKIQEQHLEIEKHLRAAETAEGERKNSEYEAARQAQLAAAMPIATWPEAEKPKVLRDLEQVTEELSRRIADAESQTRAFDVEAEKVRALKANPSTYRAALDELRELMSDKRFFVRRETGEDEPIHALKQLSRELDALKGIPDLLLDAERAQEAEDWGRVKEISEQVIDSRKAGEFAGRVKEMLAEANRELAIARAREHLKEDEVRQADAILSKLVATEKDAVRKSTLESRLQSQLEEIRRARANTDQGDPSLGMLFTQAETLAQSPDPDSRLRALRMFRYISMDTNEVRQENKNNKWPESRLSLRTADARQRAEELIYGSYETNDDGSRGALLQKGLRAELLEPLQTSYDKNPEIGKYSEGDLAPLAECARLLRSERLLFDESEKKLVRWAEVEYKSRRARDRQNVGDWKGAVAIWKVLVEHHVDPELDRNLRHAQIELAVQHADASRQKGDYDEAIKILHEAQSLPGLAEAWQLDLALAQVYTDQKNFIRAIDLTGLAMRHAANIGSDGRGRDTEIHSKEEKGKKDVQQRIAVQTAEIKARRGFHEQGPAKALRLLQGALAQDLTRNHSTLTQMRGSIFDKTAGDLLEKAVASSKRGSEQDRIDAVVALLDLRALEEIVEMPENERRSTQALKPMEASLRKVAESVINEASGFDPVAMPISEALMMVNTLLNRLHTFSKVAQLLGSDIGDIPGRLETEQGRLDDLKRRLERLNDLLESASLPGLWSEAVRTGIFETLDTLKLRIQKQQLNDMLVVRHFQKRLNEWKTTHNYLINGIAAIRELFHYKENAAGESERYEDFTGCVAKVRAIRQRPNRQPESDQLWEQLGDEDYAQIYEEMGSRLRIVPQFGDHDLTGWEQVEQEAIARQDELEAWKLWLTACEPAVEQAKQTYDTANSQSDTLTLGEQLRGWKAALEHAQDVERLLSDGPIDDDNAAVPMRSKKANEHDRDRKENLIKAKQWLAKAERQVNSITNEIESLGKFPTAAEFSDAANQRKWKGADRLGAVLERARKIGPSSPAEERMIQVYEKRFSKMSKGRR